MSTNPHVTEHAINQVMCAAWITRIEGVNTERGIKQTLLDLLRAGNYAAFENQRQTLLGDNHGQGFTWKPRFEGFWAFINALFSWLFGEHKSGSPLFRALEPKIVYTPPEPLPAPENLKALLGHHQYYIPADFHQYLKGFAKTSPEAFIASFTNGCDLHLMSELPENFGGFENSYIFIGSNDPNKLYYVDPSGEHSEVRIDDFYLLKHEINSLRERNEDKLRLSAAQITSVITSNGGHTLTNNWNALPEADNDYRFLYMDVLVECLLKTTMPGNVLEQKAYVLQELLLVLATDPASLPETYQKLQQMLPQSDSTSNLVLLERRLAEIPKSHMPPLVEHVARRGVEMLLSALPLTDEGKNEHLYKKSPFRSTITLLCTKILSIRSPDFTEEQFARLTAPVLPATPFGDYKYVSHDAFAISLAFIRGGLEGALWTFFDAVNRRVIATEQQRAFVIARLQEIPERLVHTTEKLLRLLDIIKTTPLNPMSGTQEAVERQINARIDQLRSPSSACSSSTAPNDCCSTHALHNCGTFATPQPGTPPHTNPTQEVPGTEVPGTSCQ